MHNFNSWHLEAMGSGGGLLAVARNTIHHQAKSELRGWFFSFAPTLLSVFRRVHIGSGTRAWQNDGSIQVMEMG